MQKLLAQQQISEFYTDCFAVEQVLHFEKIAPIGTLDCNKTIVDIGGGCGHFAKQLHYKINRKMRVVDLDPVSIEACRSQGIDAALGDALLPPYEGDEEVVCFNLILHHLVANDEVMTRDCQKKALLAWRNKAKYIFINEYIYESFIASISGRLIYEITKSPLLSAFASMISKFAPSLRANTFGVGVRFRSHDEWVRLFEEIGFRVLSRIYGADEDVSLPRRLLLIKKIRRDSFILEASPQLSQLRPASTD